MVTIVEENREQSQTKAVIDHITSLSAPVEQRDRRKTELARILLDDKYKESIIPGYRAIKIIEETNTKDHNQFLKSMHDRMREIEGHDRLLATVIGKAIHFEKEPIIRNALLILTKYPGDRVYLHFSKFRDGYNTRIISSKNTYLARWTMVLVDNFLRNYKVRNEGIKEIDEIENALNGRIQSLVNSYNGMSKATVETMKLAGKIEIIIGKRIVATKKEWAAKDVKPITHFLMYYEEIKFLRDKYEKILRGIKEGNWEDFRKIQNATPEIVGILDKTFGDEESAKLFEKWGSKGKAGLHDNPIKWAGEVKNLIVYLQGRWKYIFSEALETINKLFSERRLSLQNRFEGNFNKIKDKANTLLMGEKKEPKKTAKDIMGFVSKRKKVFDKEMIRRRSMYEKSKNKAFPDVMAFRNAINKFFVELNLEDFIGGVDRLRTDNLRMTGPLVATSKRFTGKYPNYDMVVLGRLKGFAAGIMANDRTMLDSAIGVRRGALTNYRNVIEKREHAIVALNRLIVDLSNLMENKEVLKNG